MEKTFFRGFFDLTKNGASNSKKERCNGDNRSEIGDQCQNKIDDEADSKVKSFMFIVLKFAEDMR